MEYVSQPNLLLEALTFYGRRASGNTWARTDERLAQRRAETAPEFQAGFADLKALTKRLDKKVPRAAAEAIPELFCNLEGFPFNAIGSCSPAFLLYYPMLDEFERLDGDIAAVSAHICGLTASQIARNILETLDVEGDIADSEEISGMEFTRTVLALSIPEESKLSILQIYSSYQDLAKQAVEFLAPLIDALQAELPALLALTDSFAQEMSALPEAEFFKNRTRLKPAKNTRYLIRPFIFGMDTNLTFEEKVLTVDIYCGFLRKFLLHVIQAQASRTDTIHARYHLLGDRTRFDILCYLRDRTAYGQELSEHFGFSRNTIHHHMNKMADAGLVRCTVDGNRVYYTLDKESMREFIEDQKNLFLS